MPGASEAVPSGMKNGMGLGQWFCVHGVETLKSNYASKLGRGASKFLQRLDSPSNEPSFSDRMGSGSVQGRQNPSQGPVSPNKRSSDLSEAKPRPLPSSSAYMTDMRHGNAYPANPPHLPQQLASVTLPAAPPMVSPAGTLPSTSRNQSGSGTQALAPIQKGAWIDLEHLKTLAKQKQMQQQPK